MADGFSAEQSRSESAAAVPVSRKSGDDRRRHPGSHQSEDGGFPREVAAGAAGSKRGVVRGRRWRARVDLFGNWERRAQFPVRASPGAFRFADQSRALGATYWSVGSHWANGGHQNSRALYYWLAAGDARAVVS